MLQKERGRERERESKNGGGVRVSERERENKERKAREGQTERAVVQQSVLRGGRGEKRETRISH